MPGGCGAPSARYPGGSDWALDAYYPQMARYLRLAEVVSSLGHWVAPYPLTVGSPAAGWPRYRGGVPWKDHRQLEQLPVACPTRGASATPLAGY